MQCNNKCGVCLDTGRLVHIHNNVGRVRPKVIELGPAGIVVAGRLPVVLDVEGPVTRVVTEEVVLEEVVWGRVLVVETSKHWE
jgi:hypothetical protein